MARRVSPVLGAEPGPAGGIYGGIAKQGAEAMSTTANRELVVTRMIDAPRPLVFKAWTDPEQIAHWWGPKGFVTVDYEMDIRPGGAYRLTMRSPEGTDHRKRGVYLQIIAP